MTAPENNYMRVMQGSSWLFGMNGPFIEGLYEGYLADPGSVPEAWRACFDALQAAQQRARETAHAPLRRALAGPRHPPVAASAPPSNKALCVAQLVNAYRSLGLRAAVLDPLDHFPRSPVAELDPAYYGLSEADRDVPFETDWGTGTERLTLGAILQALHKTYCGSVGAEYMYIGDMARKRWIQQRLEGGTADCPAAQHRRVLEQLTAAETLEHYLHTRFSGQKRFSLEGGETLIPLLDHLLRCASGAGVQEAVIGMAHRGRLNVLVNIMGKLPSQLFAEFEGVPARHLAVGEVKYHNGFSADLAMPNGPLHAVLAFNPSHLEIVGPVVEGSVRARQHSRGDLDGSRVMPVLLHGDAAFSGQGVVMEMLALSQTRGFSTGGTLHIIVNNQIGFTTSDLRDARSSSYCSDVAKMVEAPIFHVNADDPDAVLRVAEIVLDYRMAFKRDAVIDLVCFRKLGHNEQDEPMVTQPYMYRRIAQHPGTRALYAQRLLEAGIVKPGEPEAMIADFRGKMHGSVSPVAISPANARTETFMRWARIAEDIPWDMPVDTAVPRERLRLLGERLTAVPLNFALHPLVKKILTDRHAMARGELPLDWGMAESLAYASLLTEGYPVRLSGQDSARGTFFHRHAELHDQNRVHRQDGVYVPLANLEAGQADFLVIDSLLSEAAVLAYEYGYATADPGTLVIWEAQFGDFANAAQVAIDQFITSGEAKWGRKCGLVMLLPHGHEGQGAEHSSGRIERYLQLCADYNIQVCIPSTPAQMFHLLRRQMLRPLRKPLVVFTPKSLLRSKEAASPLAHFAEGGFMPVLGETETLDVRKVTRIIACSGKIYYELAAKRRARGMMDAAIIRIEQLYPFPHDAFAAQIAAFPQAAELVWCQEEPGNQGAWHRIQHYLQRHLRPGMKLDYALRASSPAPASGYLSLHIEQQKDVVEAAFRRDLDIKVVQGGGCHAD